MTTISLQTARYIRGYEPTFRSLLEAWLKSQIELTGNPNLTVTDVSAGVAHVFSAISSVKQVQGGDPEKALDDFNNKRVLTTEEAKNDLRTMVRGHVETV